MVGFLFRIFSYAHRVKSILKFAIAHMDFMATGDKDWVFFGHNDKRYAWRNKAEALKPKNTVPDVNYGIASCSGASLLSVVLVCCTNWMEKRRAISKSTDTWNFDIAGCFKRTTGNININRLTLTFWNGLSKIWTSSLLKIYGLCFKPGFAPANQPI